MKRYFQLWTQQIKFSIQRLFEYRSDFFMWSFVAFGWTCFQLVFYNVLLVQSSTIAGWTSDHVLAFIGTFMILDGLTWGLLWGNMNDYTQSVFNGSLDVLLTQPLDPQFRLSTRNISFTNLPRVIIGIFLVIRHAQFISLQQFFFFILMIFCAFIAVYALWFFTTTFTFWAEKMSNIIEIVPTLRGIWYVPAEVYVGPLSTLLTIILPFALITTVPARILFHDYRWNEIGILIIFTVILFTFTRWFFHYSIKKYSGIGS